MKKHIAHIVYIAVIALLGWQIYKAGTAESNRTAERSEEQLLGKTQKEPATGLITRGESTKIFEEGTCSFSSNGEFFFIDGIVVLAPDTELHEGTVLCVDGRESRVAGNRPALLYPGHTANYPVLDSSFDFSRASIGNCTKGTAFNKIHFPKYLPDNVRIKIEEAANTAFLDYIKENIGNDSVIGGINGDRKDIFKGLNKYLAEIENGGRKPDSFIHIDVYERNGYAYGLVSVNYEDTINFEEGDIRSSEIPEGNVSRKVLLAAGFGDFRYHKNEAGDYVTDDVEIDRFELAWDLEVQNRLGGDIHYDKSIHTVSDLDGDANPEFYYTSSHYESNGGDMVEVDLKTGDSTSVASWGCGF